MTYVLTPSTCPTNADRHSSKGLSSCPGATAMMTMMATAGEKRKGSVRKKNTISGGKSERHNEMLRSGTMLLRHGTRGPEIAIIPAGKRLNREVRWENEQRERQEREERYRHDRQERWEREEAEKREQKDCDFDVTESFYSPHFAGGTTSGSTPFSSRYTPSVVKPGSNLSGKITTLSMA